MSHPDSRRVKKSLRFSFLDGIFASAMSGFTLDYFAPFLLLLGGSVSQVGILNALPNFFASLTQLKSADLVEKLKSRKKVINTFVLVQALVLVPMAFVALRCMAQPAAFILLVVVFTTCGAFATPAWGSLMSDLVPENKRGEYFGWRNRALGFILVGATFAAGFILHLLEKLNAFYGFAIIFACAFVFRVVSWYFLSRMHEPSLHFHRDYYFSLYDFLVRIKESNFAKFVIFVSLMSFSVNLASPFFAVLMLRDFGFSYLLYTLITVTATITVYSMIHRWGRHADRVGNLSVLRLCAPLIGVIPLLWIFNHHPLFLLFAQIFSGFLWAGFNLCATNFIYDAVIPQKRTRCIAYFNVLNGLALAMGALTGGFFIEKLPLVFGYKIFSLLLISSALRIGVGLIMPLMVKEVRPVVPVNHSQLFFSVIGMKPIPGIDSKQ